MTGARRKKRKREKKGINMSDFLLTKLVIASSILGGMVIQELKP